MTGAHALAAASRNHLRGDAIDGQRGKTNMALHHLPSSRAHLKYKRRGHRISLAKKLDGPSSGGK